jgi:hypothetical protein
VAPDDYAGAGTEGAWDEGGTMKRKKRLRTAALALAASGPKASITKPKTIGEDNVLRLSVSVH